MLINNGGVKFTRYLQVPALLQERKKNTLNKVIFINMRIAYLTINF